MPFSRPNDSSTLGAPVCGENEFSLPDWNWADEERYAWHPSNHPLYDTAILLAAVIGKANHTASSRGINNRVLECQKGVLSLLTWNLKASTVRT